MSDEGEARTAPLGGNILLLVADDIGVDKIHAYREHPEAPKTPNIDALAARGVLFRNAYAPPSCSPSRAAMLTGRFGRRMGVGQWIHDKSQAFEMPLETLTIPEMLDRESGLGYDNALAGKWHLASFDSPSSINHPRASGFHRHAGSAGNLNVASVPSESKLDYYHWERIEDGGSAFSDYYATTVTAEDALVFVETMPEPWFLMVAFNAAHVPLTIPPASLHTRSAEEIKTRVDRFDVIVEALDTEIGRLLSSIEAETLARTTVLFVGDNGTPQVATEPPFHPERAKETLYEGGTNVPLIVAGPAVAEPGTESAALVHVVDIFATVADIAGVQPDQLKDPKGARLILDGLTLLPYLRDPRLPSQREYLYTEYFGINGKPPYLLDERAVRDRRWKLIRRKEPREEFFDLQGRPDDGPNLLQESLNEEARAAYERLSAELDRLTEELVYAGY